MQRVQHQSVLSPKQPQQNMCPQESSLGSLVLGGLVKSRHHIEHSSSMLACVPRHKVNVRVCPCLLPARLPTTACLAKVAVPLVEASYPPDTKGTSDSASTTGCRSGWDVTRASARACPPGRLPFKARPKLPIFRPSQVRKACSY